MTGRRGRLAPWREREGHCTPHTARVLAERGGGGLPGGLARRHLLRFRRLAQLALAHELVRRAHNRPPVN